MLVVVYACNPFKIERKNAVQILFCYSHAYRYSYKTVFDQRFCLMFLLLLVIVSMFLVKKKQKQKFCSVLLRISFISTFFLACLDV